MIPYAGVPVRDLGLLTTSIFEGSLALCPRAVSFANPIAQPLFGLQVQVFLTPRSGLFALGDFGGFGSNGAVDMSGHVQAAEQSFAILSPCAMLDAQALALERLLFKRWQRRARRFEIRPHTAHPITTKPTQLERPERHRATPCLAAEEGDRSSIQKEVLSKIQHLRVGSRNWQESSSHKYHPLNLHQNHCRSAVRNHSHSDATSCQLHSKCFHPRSCLV
jgi:hypothetical protein